MASSKASSPRVMAMIVTSWSRGFRVSCPSSRCGSAAVRSQGYWPVVGASGATSAGWLPLPMSVEKVTVAEPSLGSSGVLGSKALVVTLAAIAPASVAKFTTVGMPTRFPKRSASRTVQVVVSYSRTVV